MNAITPISKQLTLIRREFWEQRIMFILVPVGIIMLAAVFFSLATFRNYVNDVSSINIFVGGGFQFTGQSAEEAMITFVQMPPDAKVLMWNRFYYGPIPLVFITFWGCMIYYYLMTLFQQRKDRGILFWNSMPVSNAQTVISKLLAGLFIAQMIYVLVMLAVQLVCLVVFLVYGMAMGLDLWANFIEPAHIFRRTFWLMIFAAVNVFWCLPVYAWMLMISSWARMAPLAWAVAPLVAVIIPELIIYGRSDILSTVFEHAIPTWMFDSVGTRGDFTRNLPNVLNGELVLGAIIGMALVYATIRINRSEDI